MKLLKNSILIILVMLSANLFGQAYPGDPAEYDSVTTVTDASNTFVELYDWSGTGEINIMSWARLNQLLGASSTLKASDNTWTGANNFTNSLQAPSTISAELVRGVGYSSGLFSWVNDDTVRVGADRAWVLNALDTAGIAAGASTYATTDGDNTFTGTNIFSNRAAFGSGVNTGELLVPTYTTTNEPPDISKMFWFNSTNNKLYVNNGGTVKTFLDSAGVKALVTTGSYWTTSSAQTGLTGVKTIISGGGLVMSSADKFIPPDYGGATTVAGNLMWGGDEYYYYQDDLTLEVLMNNQRVNAKLDSLYSYNIPATSSASSGTLYFTDRNYIQTIYTPAQGGTTLFINDDYYGAVSIVVLGTQEETAIIWSYDTALTGGIKWVGGVAPTFDWSATTKYYEVLLKRLNATTILGSWTYYQ